MPVPKKQKQDQWMRSTFEPRDLPVAIIFDNGEIIGPFCIHCGGTLFYHGPNRRCPRKVGGLWPRPCCSCHASTDSKPTPGTKILVTGAHGTHLTTVTPAGQATRP